MTGLFLVTGEASTSDLEWAHAKSLQVRRHPISTVPYLPAAARAGTALKFSLSFFANDEDAMTGPKYRLLLEAARLADAEGLHAIWFPERHFHSFGGLYPSPAAIGAALATATERIGLRAGSVVLPLHDPIRVAEEWAVIDNLSGGRAGVSFASGWHADDFVLAPGRYADRRDIMAEGIDLVRRLWRGEPIERVNGVGEKVEVAIRPRPVQAELPFWLTAAGNPETFRAAGRTGASLLTNLMGHTLDDLSSKVDAYRRAWDRPGRGEVTLMLHTFLAENASAAYELAREPLLSYFRSSLDITRGFLASQGLGIRLEDLSPADVQALLEHGVERYLRDGGGLFGTVESCSATLERLRAAGVDEVAALIDFGIPVEQTLHSVRLLARMAAAERGRARRAQDTRLRVIETEIRELADLAGSQEVTAIQACPDALEWMLEWAPGLLGGREVLTREEPGREDVLCRVAAAGGYPLIEKGNIAARVLCGPYGERTVRPERPVSVVDKLGRRLGIGVVGLLRPDDGAVTAQRARWRPDGRLDLLPSPPPRTAPVSYAQQRLWTLDRLIDTKVAYNNPVALRMHGRLEVAALSAALDAVVRRHEALRTVFPATDDGPVQVILPAEPLPLPVTDTTPDEVQKLAHAHARLPFGLETGPLLRARLLRLSDVEHVLLICMHHIVSDGWTAGVLFTDLAAVYAAHLEQQPPVLPQLRARYADFVTWQRGLDFTRELAYWRRTLAEAPLLELPLDRPRGPVQNHDGARYPVRLDPELTRALRALCAKAGVTLFMALQAGLVTLLHRYSGQADIVTGTAVSGRSRPEFEGLAGVFVNLVALRNDATGDPSFLDLLRRVKATALEAFAHQEVPFERLVDELKVTRDLSLAPLFQAMLLLHNTPRPTVRLGSLTLETLEFDAGVSKLDLLLELREEGEGVVGAWEYNTAVLGEATVARLGEHLTTLLSGAVSNPDLALSRLPMMSDQERTEILGLSHGATLQPAGTFAGVGEAFAAQAARTPSAPAIGDDLTYAALDGLADRVAFGLRECGCEPGDRVALVLDRAEDGIAAMLGALKAGVAYVPIDPQAPPARREELLSLASPRLVVSELDAVMSGRGERFEPVARGEDVAYVIFTSGSTGHPKGVVVSHAQLLASTWARVAYYDGPAKRCVAPYPLHFDASVGWIYYTLLTGGTLWFGDGPDPRGMAGLVGRVAADRFSAVPAFYARLLEAAEPGQLASLKTVSVIGERCPPDLARQHFAALPGVEFHNEYGPTEATVWCTSYLVPGPLDGGIDGEVPIGRPIPGAAALVLDRTGGLLPVNAAGELHVGGLGVADGYLHQPELTAEKFIDSHHGRLYRTGDLARWNRHGQLEFLGRIDRQVKVRGFRVEPAEVETALAGHPAIRETTVVARAEHGTTRLIAYAATPDGSAEPEELLAFLRTRLPDYLVPARVVVLPALPRGATGKVDVAALPVPEAGGEPRSAPLTDAERALAGVFSEILGGQAIGVHDDIFEAGVDSLLAITAVTRARKAGFDLDVQQVFRYPTVAGLARVATKPADRTGTAQPLTGPVPLGPTQQRFFAWRLQNPVPWNGSVYLELNEPVDPDALEKAFRAVIRHHDALRLRFTENDGRWESHYADPDEEWNLWRLDRPDRAELDRLQASMDLAKGPLLRAAIVHTGQSAPDRLLVTAHHLVIDGLSWRIVLEDLLAAYRGMPLPPKTASYREFTAGAAAFLTGSRAHAELAYWTGLDYGKAAALPRDGDGPNVEGRVAVHRTRLGGRETARLAAGDVNAALVTAVATAVAEWTSSEYAHLDLQRHGRQDLVPGLDLSRTVGWFSLVHPVVVHVPTGVGNVLRNVPAGGVAYLALRYGLPDSPLLDVPPPEVILIYQGRLDAVLPPGAPAHLLDEPVGRIRDAQSPRNYLISVMAGLHAGTIWLNWSYTDGIHLPATIERVAGRAIEVLRDLAAP